MAPLKPFDNCKFYQQNDSSTFLGLVGDFLVTVVVLE